jgi:hypothetical protein
MNECHEKKPQSQKTSWLGNEKPLLFAFCWHYLATTIEAIWAHVMTQMYFTRRWLNRQRWVS